MARDNLLGQVGRQVLRGTTLFLEHGDVITLRTLRALLPPEAQGGHIVGGEGGNRAIGVTIKMGKLKATLLRHGLDFEREDAEGIEHRGYAIGQHAQILSTTEHARITKHLSKMTHSLIAPEDVVTLVIVVVVKAHIGILLLCRKGIEYRFANHTDTRMIHITLLRILEEEHTTDESVESIANPQTILIAPTLERLAHLLLRVVFRLEVIESVGSCGEEVLAHIRRMHTEETVEHTIINKRLRKEILAERQAEVFYLAHSHRQRGREMA